MINLPIPGPSPAASSSPPMVRGRTPPVEKAVPKPPSDAPRSSSPSAPRALRVPGKLPSLLSNLNQTKTSQLTRPRTAPPGPFLSPRGP